MVMECSSFDEYVVQDDAVVVWLGKQVVLQYMNLQEVGSSFTFASCGFVASFTW